MAGAFVPIPPAPVTEEPEPEVQIVLNKDVYFDNETIRCVRTCLWIFALAIACI